MNEYAFPLEILPTKQFKMMYPAVYALATWPMCAFHRAAIVIQTQAANRMITSNTRYPGPLAVLVRTRFEQGFTAHFRGYSCKLLEIPLRYFLMRQYAFRDPPFTRTSAGQYDARGRKPAWQLFLERGFLGTALAAITHPCEVAYTHLATDMGRGARGRKYTGFHGFLFDVFTRDQFVSRSIYRGITCGMAFEFLFRGVQLTVIHPDWKEKYCGRMGSLLWFASAQILTAGALTVAYPLDTIRRCIVMGIGQSAQQSVQSIHWNGRSVARHIMATSGIKGFYSGLSVHLAGAFMTSVVLMGTIDRTLVPHLLQHMKSQHLALKPSSPFTPLLIDPTDDLLRIA